jgi:hypothetical protein
MNPRQSYRQRLDLERNALAALGQLSERYAGVSKIEFHMKCMEDGCTGGGFDLAPVVAGLAKSHKKSTKGKVYCHGMNHTFGHASIAYEVNIQYHKQVK